MARFQQNDNFIDKTFTILAESVVKILPASRQEKEAFNYYKEGLTAQASGRYAEALESYYEALKLEEDPIDRSYILYNIGLIYSNNGEYSIALDYYHQAIALNKKLSQAYNNSAVIYHYQGMKSAEKNESELATKLFARAAKYWQLAIRLAPNNYIEAENWLITTGRKSPDMI
jgi:tetratricopeptide (TPR) repeat protein|uniref:Photosystem I assembly protein Ycf3 n=1 Tax=Eustigmatophyceae sp. Chic 10/23 P-6w TaxID=1446905 RepID=A0A3R5V1D3_9STRA|nr:photosystem I assembly protein ycf3 [Eustigmatophyceae sp. Chic 10/23 P-6w]QAA11578.1 photosystem I assembly protein ycf3 [Eustigmatophyceae sp. Chic 10/23 P-6w]